MNLKLKKVAIATISAGFVAGAVMASAQSATSCFQFTENMKLGSSGAQVLQLQKTLNSMGYTVSTSGVGSAGMETSYFGAKTKAAAIKFQAANNIIQTGNVFALTRAALNANCTATTPTTPGNTTTSGAVSVALASMQPNNVLVAGAARAKLADLVFSGNGTVVSVKLMRTGVSNNSTLSNVYLYDASTGVRLTDAASVLTDGSITFNNATGIFSVSGTKTVSVLADIYGTNTSGQSVGVSLVGYTTVGNPAAVVSGVNGPALPIGSADLAKAYFGSVTPGITSMNAGTTGATVWSSALNIATRAINLSSMTFKMVGSAPMDALANVKLYVDGVQFANASAFSANGYVTFYSTTPLSLTTGSHTFDVRADIVKGSSRSFYITLENAGDIALADSQITGANITAYTSNAYTTAVSNLNGGGSITISGGSLTISQNSAFTASSLVGGSTNQTFGSFKFYAYGEDVKVRSLTATVATTSALSPTSTKLNNVTVYVNGGAVSSGVQATLGTSFTVNLGSNLIVPAGSSAIVEVKGDLVNENSQNVTSGGLQVSLSSSTDAQGMYSYNTVSVPTATGQTLSVNSGNVAYGSTSGFTAANISKNQTGVKIGSFALQAGSAEAINVTNINIILGGTATPATNYTNLRITDGSNTVVPVSGTNNFSVNYDVAAGTTKVIEVWVDTLDIANGSTTIASSTVTYRGKTSSVTNTLSATGPTMTAASVSVGTPTLVNGSTLSSRVVVGGKTLNSVATYNVVSTNGSATINDLSFTVSGSQSGTVESLSINGVTANVISGVANFYGINLPVTSGVSGLNIPVAVKYSAVTASNQGGVASGATTSLALTSMKYTAGGTQTTVTPSVSANTMTLAASVPTLSVNGTQATGLIIGAENKVGEFTVTADAAGQIRVATTTFTLTSSGISTSTYSAARIADGNTTVSGSSCSVSSSTVTCALGNYVLSAGQSKTFSLFATVNGTAQASVTVSVSSALSAAGFLWDDNTGGSALSGSSIYNFPTNSYSIKQ